MPNYFSDHYATVSGSTSQDDPRIKVSAGIAHGKLRYKNGRIPAPVLVDLDELRLFQMKSSDRLIELYLSSGDLGGTITASLGLYLTDDGAVVDINLFIPNRSVGVVHSRLEAFTDAALLDTQRGDSLWQLLGLSEDPQVVYDMVLTITGTVTTGLADTVQVEAYYTPLTTA